MSKIHLISSTGVSRKVVQKILCGSNQIVAMALKQIFLDKPGDLVTCTIGTLDGHVYVFDIKCCKNIMTEGELWRILQSEDIIKVMHDCRQSSSRLKTQFSVTLRNVFDTQAAYCMVMMLRELPPRFIHLHSLYEKFGDPAQKMSKEIKDNVQGSSIFWAQRPLSDYMLQSMSTDVLALIPACYENLKRELSPTYDSVLSDLCHAYIHGKFKVKDKSSREKSPSKNRPILRLTESQQYLLEHTIPQSSGALTYKK